MNGQGKNISKKIDDLINDAGKLSEQGNDRKKSDKPSYKTEGTNKEGKKASSRNKEEQDNTAVKEEGQSDEPRRSKKGYYIAGAILIILAIIGAGYAYTGRPLSDAKKNELYANGTFCEGISVFDVDVSGETIEAARKKLSGKVDINSDQVLLELKLKDNIIPVKASDLHVGNTVDSVLKEAMLFGKEGHLIKRYMDRNNAKTKGQKFDIEIYTDEASLKSLVNTIVTNYSIPAKDADVQIQQGGSERFSFTPEQVGLEISPDGLADKIKNHIESRASGYIDVEYREVAPKITEAALRQNTVLRGTYSTNVSGSSGRRKNVALAASKINGKKVMPGEEFNIEAELGARTKENGWNIGGEIVNGELVNGYGGGICQASTTLFNSVIRADLEVVKRSNHSQTVGYVPLGFDATISSGGPYFIWKNNTDYPIFIFASASMSKITIDLYGAPLPYGDNITYDEVVSASGTVTSGRRVQSALVFYSNGKEVHRRSWSSSYRGKPVKVTTQATTTATTAETTVAPTQATAAPTQAPTAPPPTPKPTQATTKPTPAPTQATTTAKPTTQKPNPTQK